MRYNDSIILIENPLTGNTAVGDALRLASNGKQYDLPGEVRESIDWDWKSLRKMILVRDPVQRFLCGAQRWCEAHGLHGSLSSQNRPLEVLRQLNQLEELPIIFRPQTDWLTCAYDIILATHDIATWANSEKHFCYRLSSNRFNAPYVCHPSPELMEKLAEFYSADYEVFKTLPLWCADPKMVRLLSGNCIPCAARIERAEAKKKARRKRPVSEV